MYGGHHHNPRRPAPPLQPQPPPNYYYSPPPHQSQPINPYYYQNPNNYLQSPPPYSTLRPNLFPNPNPSPNPNPNTATPPPQVLPFQSPSETLQRIDKAVAKAHRELVASGESVSAFKVSNSVIFSLKVDSWSSLGFQMQQIPSLYRLMLVEGKVNAFIHCFVAVRRITSLHDLDIEICKNEGVQRFEELELGPLLRHPLVIHYFLPSDTKEIVNITSAQIVSYLVEFMDIIKHKSIKPEEFLDFLAVKLSLPAKEKLGIRIQSLRMHVNSIREARKAEDSILSKCIGSMRKTTKEGHLEGKTSQQPSISLQKKVLKKRYFAIERRIKSFSPIHKDSAGKHIKFVSSNSENEDEDEGEGGDDEEDYVDDKDDIVLCSPIASHNKNISENRSSSCPYPSVNEEKARLGLKIDMGGQSSHASDIVRCDDSRKLSAKKRKSEKLRADYPFKFPKKDKAELSEQDMELLQDVDDEQSHHTENRLEIDDVDKTSYLRLTDDEVEQFITTWKEACRLHSVPEVFLKMLNFYNSTERRKKTLKSTFKSFPSIGLLHVAVTSMKYGMWDSLYDTFQAIGEREYRTSSSAPPEPESISIEPSCGKEAISSKGDSSQIDRSISVNDISENVSTYFDLNHALSIEGKSTLEKQFIFLRKLHDCELWLTKQFSVEEFSSLGHGEFYNFLEEHPFLIPNELLDNLFGHVSKKSSFEVSMLHNQVIILLSQAASCLWGNEAITKEQIHKLLNKQFPLIGFHVSGNGQLDEVSAILNTPRTADNCSVLFSATLLGSYFDSPRSNNHLLDSIGVNPDMGLISGALGWVYAKDAIECLLRAPMLSDLLSWSHWDLIYAPSLGPLVEWLLKEVYIKELLCLVTKDGKIIRIHHSATVDRFLDALLKGSAYETAIELLSLFSLYGGERNVPIALLKCHSQRGIEIILKNSLDCIVEEDNCNIYMRNDKSLKDYALDDATAKQPLLNLMGKSIASLNVKDQHGINKAVSVTSRFILDCLCYLPSEFCSFAAGIMLSGFQPFVEDAPLFIIRECSQTHQRLMLHRIGLSLNICEWIEDYRAFISSSANELSVSSGASSTLALKPTSCLDSKFKNAAAKELSSSDDRMVVGVESGEHNDMHGEVHENMVNEMSSEKFVDGYENMKVDESQDGNLIVEAIRREEFGLVSNLTEVDNIMLKKQHARLGRALQCLSQELYSQNSHFLLELVQNADDNIYMENVEPTLVFILQSTGIVVLNNEIGFTAQNIRALCDVGNSTKKGSNAGYIGQKGIGFKSVFRVTDAPEIHSNGFHVKFDISEGQIGFVLPTVVSPCDIASLRRLLPGDFSQFDTCCNTCIVLPFNSKLRDGMGLSSIVSLFSDLHPSLLLFLHRLQCIKFKNMLNDSFTVMKRENLEDGIVKVSHGKETMSWFVATQDLQASIIRPDVETTKIAVAFTLKESTDGEYMPHLEQQPVFAFLPLRTYGLKFILQGDFILPSSREEVDADSAWNQWLLSEFPGLFVSAQRSFCDLRCFQERPGRAVTAYMSFVPLVGEVHGFFSQLPRMIISKLRTSNCLLVEGKREWVPPCRVLRGWNEQAQILLSDNLLHQHLGLGFLDKDISLSDALAKALGVNDYGPKILIEVISSICCGDGGVKSLGLHWLSSWLCVLYIMLVHSSAQTSVNAWVEADISKMLGKIAFIPLSDGTYGSTAEGTIWLTCDADNYGFEREHGSKAFPVLYANLRTVSHAFLSAAAANTYGWEEVTVDNVIKMLSKTGVQRLSAHELIKVHILPALSDNGTAEMDKNLMIEYISFVMFHLQSNCPNCRAERKTIISELQTNAFILTTHGYKRLAELPIHFSREFGNPVDMRNLIDVGDSAWHEVDIIYLNQSSGKSLSFGLNKWREFFQELGITDFMQAIQVEKKIEDMSHSLLKDIMCNGDLIASGLVAKDWESPELVHLLSIMSSQNKQEKSKYLLEVLDKMWDDYFCTKVTGCCIQKSSEDGKLFKSSFIRSFNDVPWMASCIDQKLHYPKDLFYDCEEVRSILGNFAPYAIPQVSNRNLISEMGLKTHVTTDDAMEILRVLQNFEGPATASIDQMSRFYACIWSGTGTAKAEIVTGFDSGPFIFLPHAKSSRPGDVVSGKLYSSEEVYWHDPTGAVDLTQEMLLQCGSLTETKYLITNALAHIYKGLHDFFVNECKVCEIPHPRRYIEILVQLSKVALPSQAANVVLHVLLKWANDLSSGLLEPEDVVYLKDCLLKLETTVLPTEQDKWASLHPSFGLLCWCDNEELWKQFKHSDNIGFVYFGELSLDEKRALPAKISGLMQALGVPSLSEVITREAIFYGMDDSREKALLVNWVLPYAQRYIYKLHPDKYIQLKQSRFENICNLRIVLVEKLFYRNTVKGCDNASNKRIECNCLLQGNNLYVVRASNSHPIFMELSRLFFNGIPELHIANFLHLIATMAESGSTEEQMDVFVVDSQEIPKLPDEEPVWFLSSLLSPEVDDMNTESSFASATIDEQNLLQSKRRVGINTNWPPADWKTAPDFSFARENRLMTKSVVPPPTDNLQRVDKAEGITCTEALGVPVGSNVDWIIEDNSLQGTSDVSQDFGAREDRPLYGSSGLAIGKAEELKKALRAITDSENFDINNFSERDQLSFQTPNEFQAALTGRMGEHVAFRYFSKKVGGASVKWVNEGIETGLPYDIVIGDGEDNKEYIEVKATKSAKKDWFTISTREWQFAIDRGESFSIAHVLLMGPNNAKVTVFKNPLRLCQQGMLRLSILMPKSQDDT